MRWEFSELVNKYVNPTIPTLDDMSNLTFWENTNSNLRDGVKAYKQLLHVYDALGVKPDFKTHPVVGEGF